MSKNKKKGPENLDTWYSLLLGQFTEDRESIMEQYEHLRDHLKENPVAYAVSGDTLAKYAELLIKQTAQVVEMVKLASKKQVSDGTLSEEDIKQISEEISDDKKDEG